MASEDVIEPAGDPKLKTSGVHIDDRPDETAVSDPDSHRPDDFAEIVRPTLDSPELQAGFISATLNLWFGKLLRVGWSSPLQMEDLYKLNPKTESDVLVPEFERRWKEAQTAYEEGRRTKKPSVSKITISMNKPFFPMGIMKILADTMIALTGIMMQGLITTIVDTQNPAKATPAASQAFLYAIGFFLLTMTSSTLTATTQQRSIKYAMAVKGMLTGAVYRKALRLSGTGRINFPPPKVINLVSTDIGRIEMAALQFHLIWTSLSWFIVTTVLVYRVIGPAGLVGIAVLILNIPLQGLFIRMLMRLRLDTANVTDRRINITSEILSGIRIIKFFTWEDNFMKRVDGLRDEELQFVKSAAYIRAVIQCLGFAIPAISSAVTFLVQGTISDLNPVQIFSAMALFNQLRQPVMWVPVMIATLGEAFIGFRRLQELFDSPEIQFSPSLDPNAQYGVQIVDGEFIWESTPLDEETRAQDGTKADKANISQNEKNDNSISSDTIVDEEVSLRTMTPTLRNINFTAPKGGLTAIVGAVGMGKSSMLSALIGELRCNSESVIFSGTVGYSAQQAWIANATVKQNITFGRVVDNKKYSKVIEAACLGPDIAILPDGDESEIGERGINLSGGQKQRISLARLMYTDCDIALMDDPLSAVDSNVGKTIFETGICGLMAGKTRILVTHQLHLVPTADWIVVMQDGMIAEQGTYADLMADGKEFNRLMVNYGGEEDESAEAEKPEGRPKLPPSSASDWDAPMRRRSSAKDSNQRKLSDHDNSTAVEDAPEKFHQIKSEKKQSGRIGFSVLKAYFGSYGSSGFLLTLFISLLLTQITRLANDLWLVTWTQSTSAASTNGTSNDGGLPKNEYMGIFGGLSLLQAASLLFYSILFAIGGIRAAHSLHNAVLDRVMRSAVAFFDTTPLGRIVNRLSRDQDYVDSSIYDAWRLLLYSVLQLVAAFALVSYFTRGLFLAILLPMLAVYYFIQVVYRTSSREIKRVESVSRSPLFAHISESMSGLSTIRAYNEEARFTRKTDLLISSNLAPAYLLYTGQRWIQLRLEYIGNLLVFSVALFAAAERSSINASQIGLALSYLLQTTSLLNMVVFQAVEVEVQLNAVERFVEFMELPVEEERSVVKPKPPENWPSNGEIIFSNVKMRYQPELPLVLRGVSITIRGGEKIGVVGRTGSGKSSLMQALFRMVNLADGSITIDGVETSSIKLKDLRSNLSIIPQDPLLFTGTLRSNLDPFSKYTDDYIWEVLARCGMKEAVAAMEGKLDAQFVENGENISVGQRQLICLARACLQKPKILIMDEVSASIDYESDVLLQQTIKSEFANATTLTIAHRLGTVITADRILVLGHGRVLEYDTPYNLLIIQRDSEFSKLVDETGEANASLLRGIVENATRTAS